MKFKIAEAFVSFVADIAKLRSGMRDAEGVTKEGASRIASRFGTLARIAFPAGIATGIAWAGRAAVDAADELGKLSTRTGRTVEDLSTMKYAASMADVSMSELGTSLRYVNRNMAEASVGNKKVVEAFENIGLSVEDVRQKDPKEVFHAIFDGLKKIESPALRTQVAMDLIGRSGTQMLTMLDSLTTEGFAATRREAEKYGAVISTETARASEEFNDNITRLKTAFFGWSNELVATTIPALRAVSNTIRSDAAPATIKWLNPIHLLKKAIQGVTAVVVGVNGVFRMATSLIGAYLDSIGRLATAVIQRRFGDLKGIYKSNLEHMQSISADSRDEILKAWDEIFNPPKAKDPDFKRGLGDLENDLDDTADAAAKMAAQMRVANLQLAIQIAKARGDSREIKVLTKELEDFAAAQMLAQGATDADVAKWLKLSSSLRAIEEYKAALGGVNKVIVDAIGDADRAEEKRLEEKEKRVVAHQAAIDEQLFQLLLERIARETPLINQLTSEYEASATQMRDVYEAAIYETEALFTDVLFDAVTGNLDEIEDVFKSFFKNLLRQIINFMAQQAVMNLLKSFGGYFGGVQSLQTTGATIGQFSTPGISNFASGGVVSQPTLSLTGEGAFSEAIIPMPHGAVPVELFGPESRDSKEREVSINQRIILSSDLLQAGKTSSDEIITTIAADILRGGEVRKAIRART